LRGQKSAQLCLKGKKGAEGKKGSKDSDGGFERKENRGKTYFFWKGRQYEGGGVCLAGKSTGKKEWPPRPFKQFYRFAAKKVKGESEERTWPPQKEKKTEAAVAKKSTQKKKKKNRRGRLVLKGGME